ncbi:hypothetical protein OIV83_002523 [Microbotryomycetes sp. JL201]|nr:hypothetical protein OIV83_002523 [Microbotryomycetes sp. JL201]
MYGGGYGPPQGGAAGWQQSPPGGYGSPYGAPPPGSNYGYGGAGGPRPGYGGGQPRHAGLGSYGAAPNLPPPPNLQGSPQQQQQQPQPQQQAPHFPTVPTSEGWNGEKFSLFVGSIADGVSDAWLERIVGAAGPVLTLKRPTPAFGFVEYGDPESVLRALEAVNGVKLKSKAGQEKALLIKADEKVKARLEEYEKSRVKDDSTTEYLEQTKNDLRQIVERMHAGGSLDAQQDGSSSRQGDSVPSRLNDLDENELPEEQRVVITSEIAMFRERVSKKRGEVEQEAALPKAAAIAPRRQSQARSWGQATDSQGSPAAKPDPQSFNKPIGFVAQGTQLDDEEKERERIERARKEAEAAYKDRERRVENQERMRIKNVERQQDRDRQNDEREARDRKIMSERLEDWDDDKEMDRGRESFYADRQVCLKRRQGPAFGLQRWRAQRRQNRQREQEADERDRKREQEQLAAASKASDDFLSADFFAGMGGNGTQGGLKPANGDEPVVKLSFGSVAKPAPKPAAPARPAVLMSGDDEEEGKRKRELIPLSYSDDEEDIKEQVANMSRSERDRKAREIVDRVPRSKDALWDYKIRWNVVNEKLVLLRLEPFVRNLIVESLGFEEDELLSAVSAHLKAHKPPAELVEELEPVLDEEAAEFVRKVWSKLIEQTELARHGL